MIRILGILFIVGLVLFADIGAFAESGGGIMKIKSPDFEHNGYIPKEFTCQGKEVIAYKPDFLIIGTGVYGMMKVPPGTRKFLRDNNIDLVERNTGKACEIFNEQIRANKKVVGGFHLTC